MHDTEVRERVARLDALLERIDGNELAQEVAQGLVDLYGEALARCLSGADPTRDELLSHLMLAHGLHPESVEERIGRALDEVRPYLRSHGGDVELLGVEGGSAKLRLSGTCNGCPSSTATLRNAVETAVLEAAPELDGVEAEGVAEPQPALLQIGSLECPPGLARGEARA